MQIPFDQMPGVVSEATHRLEDLVPAFFGVVETFGTAKQKAEFSQRAEVVLNGLQSDDAETLEVAWIDGHELLSDLEDTLTEMAPVGFSFGANPGDGACFGFWLSEDWETALEDRCVDQTDLAAVAELILELDSHGVDADSFVDAHYGFVDGATETTAGAGFAQQMAEDCGQVPGDLSWPLRCIDWVQAWHELRCDGWAVIDCREFSSVGGDWLVIAPV